MNFIYNTWTFSDPSLLEKYYASVAFQSTDKLAQAELHMIFYVKDNHEAQGIFTQVRRHLSKNGDIEIISSIRPKKLHDDTAVEIKSSEIEVFLHGHQTCELTIQTTIESFRMSELSKYNMISHQAAQVNKDIVFKQVLNFSVVKDNNGLLDSKSIDPLKIVRRHKVLNLEELLIWNVQTLGNFTNRISPGDTLTIKKIELKTAQELLTKNGISFSIFPYQLGKDHFFELVF